MKIFPLGSTEVCGAVGAPPALDECLSSVTTRGIPNTDLDHVIEL